MLPLAGTEGREHNKWPIREGDLLQHFPIFYYVYPLIFVKLTLLKLQRAALL